MKAIFFDLFFTLIVPAYPDTDTEYDVLDLSASQWEHYAENQELYEERALGYVKNEARIIHRITSILPFRITKKQEDLILIRREARMKHALESITPEIMSVLTELKARGYLLGLISNADMIDCKYWTTSPLSLLFDDALFSCDYEMLKPRMLFYQTAMNRLGVTPQESIFIGDGGSEELTGAKSVGMKTVFTESLIQKSPKVREQLLFDSDYHINSFSELLTFL